jgi:hypothetical protein
LQRRPLLGAGLFALTLSGRAQTDMQLLQVGDSQVEVHFDDGFEADLVKTAMPWIRRATNAVALFLGRLPLARFEILILAVPGAGIKGGTAFAEPAPFLRIRVGRETRHAHFDDDWILVHEMLHLAIPQVAQAHNWLHEGIATYAEGAARVLAGDIPAARWWGELMRGLPQGLPKAGDRGLDHTPTWGRTYWGGALFCLLADVQMRRTSDTRHGLRDALQGLLAAGGSYAVEWPIERVLAAADSSIGQTALTQLYARMKDRPEAVDLEALWRNLGVRRALGAWPTLADDAPLSAVRRAIAA